MNFGIDTSTDADVAAFRGESLQWVLNSEGRVG